jgi:negative regulator of sigma E activity
MTDESIDQELSALIDGELTAERAAALNARVASDPELKARLSTLEAVNESLRSLTSSAMPADLRARLQRRIEGGPEAATQSIDSETSMEWGKPLAAALAAGLIAAWLLFPASNPEGVQVALETPAARVSETITEATTETVTDVAENDTVHDAGVDRVGVNSDTTNNIATNTQTNTATNIATNIDAIDDIEPMLEGASDGELAIAFELEALRDLDVIQDLDLLEALLAMEDAEAQTHNDEKRG